jgi:hypothetical protein
MLMSVGNKLATTWLANVRRPQQKSPANSVEAAHEKRTKTPTTFLSPN